MGAQIAVLSNDSFSKALRRFREARGFSYKTLSREIKVPRQTLYRWEKEGIAQDSFRQGIIMRFPQVFTPDEGVVESIIKAAHDYRRELLEIKIDKAKKGLLDITAVLAWFLFRATPEDRNHFRDALGEDWEHLLALTRAMTNEKAFEIARDEGGLNWCQK